MELPFARPNMASLKSDRQQNLEQSVLNTVHRFGPVSATAISALESSEAPNPTDLTAVLDRLVNRGKVAVIFPGGKPAFVDPDQLPERG